MGWTADYDPTEELLTGMAADGVEVPTGGTASGANADGVVRSGRWERQILRISERAAVWLEEVREYRDMTAPAGFLRHLDQHAVIHFCARQMGLADR